MPGTITDLDRGSHLRRTSRSRRGGYSDTIRNHRRGPGGRSQTRSLSSNHGRLVENEQPGTADASSALASGAKAALSALLGLIPLAIALGAAGSGLLALETLAMSVFVLSGAAQMALIELISSGTLT